jgi:signal transduction histidine kinase
MSIRRKILIYFSISICLIVGIAFFIIYIIASANREDNFQKRQREKISTTLEILADIKTTEADLIETMDRISVNELPNDKLLLFNANKELIYSNLLDVKVSFSEDILNMLSKEINWVEEKDGLADVVGMYIERNGKTYFGISKAYDDFGYSKLHFLGYTLIVTFIIIVFVIVIVAFYISKKITTPLHSLTETVKNYNPSTKFEQIFVPNSKDETEVLAQTFNNQLKRINELFDFQSHTIHHISHELKTPISILVSNFERIEKETDIDLIKTFISHQKRDTHALSEIINSLLEISKLESGQSIEISTCRIDELIFDVAERLNIIYPNFVFTIQYEEPVHESVLSQHVNTRLLTSAFSNLMENSIQYASEDKAIIRINTSNHLQISFQNKGKILDSSEKDFLFEHFFRGKNSQGKRGFGLGLIFVKKILTLHQASVEYQSIGKNQNLFVVDFQFQPEN